MKENNLLASVALFSELYNSDKFKSISDILAEFIKGAVVYENRYTLKSTELTLLLEKIYEFKIPESVVRSTLKSKLKNYAEQKDGYFNFKTNISEGLDLVREHKIIADVQNDIFSDLCNYIRVGEQVELEDQTRAIIFQSFSKYLLDDGFQDKYSKYISAFLIKNELQPNFSSSLNLIKEGVILYQGIKYTADLNELGHWDTDLTIFLNTEHLCHALGYNGILFQEIFNDFLSLVNEINNSEKNKQSKRIRLKYLEETKDEVNGLFNTAEQILKKRIILNPAKIAIKKIVDECKNASDVKTLRVKFDLALKEKGVSYQDFNQNISTLAKYNVEDQDTLEQLRKNSVSNGKEFDEGLCLRYLKMFTKINYFRGGQSSTSFEKVGHILLTENSFAKYIAHNNKVKFADLDIPFAKDIDFVTTKFWFKLKKGFSNKQNLPKSFDVVTKARLILSSQLNNSVSREYKKLQEQFKTGILTREEAIERSYELRIKPNKPEDIDAGNLGDSLEFLNNDKYFEDLFREREKKDSVLKETQEENKKLAAEIERRDAADKVILNKKKLAIHQLNKENFIKEAWERELKELQIDAFYFFKIICLTILPIATAIAIKFISTFNSWMISLGNWQYLILAGLVLTALLELFGRAYLFNKERIRRGSIWAYGFIVRKNRNEIYLSYAKDKDDEYISSNPIPKE